jgi:cysteine sulfinate desulfinase/cysteine desulfurase-like protein
MKIPTEFSLGTLRLSIGRYTTEQDIKKAVRHIANVVNELR